MSENEDVVPSTSLSEGFGEGFSNGVNPLLSFYQQIATEAGYAILTLDSQGEITHVDESIKALTGHKPALLVGTAFTHLVPPDWRSKVERFHRKQRLEAEPKTTTRFPLFTREGGECWVEQVAILMPAADGIGLHLLLRDITREHEQELQAQEQAEAAQDRSIFDATFEVVVLHDGERITEVNTAFLTTFGYSRKDAIGMPFTACFVESEREAVIAHLTTAEAHILQAQAVKQDGTVFPVNLHTRQITHQGQAAYVASLEDITEEENTRRQLRTRDELYRTLARNLPDIGVMLFDHDLCYIIVEGHTLTQLGFTKEKVEGKTIYEVLSGRELSTTESMYRHALAGKFQTHKYTAHGRVFINRLFPTYDEHGQIFAGMVVVQDVTEQHRIEMELRENEHRYRGLFEQNNDAVFIVGLDGRIISANSRATELMGFPLQELIGQMASFTVVASNASTSDLNTDRLFEKILAGDPFPVYERTLMRKDDTQFIAEINTSLTYDLDGMPSHIQSIVRDITERKEIEARLEENMLRFKTLHEVDEELAENLQLEYVLNMALDSAMRLSGANIGYIALLDEEHVMRIAKMLGDYPHKIDDSFFHESQGIVGRVIRNQEAAVVQDVTADPDYVMMNPKTQAQMVIPLVSQERLIGVLNLESSRSDRFNQDVLDMLKLVTARIAVAIDNARLYKQTETQLSQLRNLYAQVSNLEQIKTDMIRIASHDLRNPLSAIMGFLEILDLDLADISAPQETRAHLANMERASRRMEKIINDILSLERIEANAQKTHDDYVDLTKLVEGIYRESEPQAILSARSMTLEIPESTVIVRGDGAQLREAIANLISNAIKYTHHNGHIDVRLYYSGSKVVLEVLDDGFGIPIEAQEKLFQPFYRVDMQETVSIEGTGLGLHLVKKIIERHNGKMLFESEYGVGSMFGFSLPYID